MARKDRFRRQIDDQSFVKAGSGEIITDAISVAGSAVHLPQSIDSLVLLGQGVYRSASTPSIAVDIGWEHPDGEIPAEYIVQHAEDEDFTINKESFVAYGLTAALYLKPATDYWIRVAPKIRTIQANWSNVLEITTIEDTIIPADVDNVDAVFENSNLIVTWDQPADEAYKNARIRIYNSDRTTLYDTFWQRESPFVLTAAENRRIGLGTPLTDVSVDVTSNSWGNTLGASVEIVSAVAPLPDTPTDIIQSWSGDDGTYDEDLTIQWSDSNNAAFYTLSLDDRDIITRTPYVVYPYTDNVADHTPALASGDPTIVYIITAHDLLDQISLEATGSATNIAPPDVFATIEIIPGFASFGIKITPDNSILDFDHYSVIVLDEDDITIIAYNAVDNIQTVALEESGTYDVEIRAVDKFGQESDPIITSTGFIDALTVEDLRAETTYSDSIATSPAILDGLKDGNTATNVITYPSSASYSWTQAARPQLDRYKVLSDSHQSALGIPVMTYFATSMDGITWRWFSGPVAFTGSTGQATTLVERADQATAETNALSLVTNVYRFDLPSIVEARFIRIYHKSANDYSYKEFYPRRLVQSDDMEAETIKSINVQAAAINAGHISVTTLGAIQTSTGTLVVNTAGYIRSGMTAYDTGTGFYLGNDSGTPKFALGNSSGMKMLWDGSNLSFRTANSNQRIQLDSNGLRGYNSSNVLQVEISATNGKLLAGAGNVIIDADGISGYNGATLQVQLRNSDGAIIAGINSVTLDADGISIVQGVNESNQIKWFNTTPTLLSKIYGHQDSDLLRNGLYFSAEAVSGYNSRIDLDANAVSGKLASIGLQATQSSAGTPPRLSISHTSSTVKEVTITNATLNTEWGVNIGTATGAGIGELFAAASASGATVGGYIKNTGGTAASTLTRFSVGQTNVESVGLLIQFAHQTDTATILNRKSSTGILELQTTGGGITINNDGGVKLSGKFGVNNTTPITKPTVTGSRGGNAALASLLTALANYGLITDSSS